MDPAGGHAVAVAVLPYPEPTLSDGVVALRPWRLDDQPTILEAWTDPEIRRMPPVALAFTAEEATAFIERQWARQSSGEGISLAIVDAATDRALGLISVRFRAQPGVAGTGYWLVPGARRRGFTRRALDLASRWALTEGGFDRIEAWVETGNLASQGVLDGAGFTREGVLRSFLIFRDERIDAVVFSRIAADLST